jgi:hypothetical protein
MVLKGKMESVSKVLGIKNVNRQKEKIIICNY